MITDDPFTPGIGKWEIETAFIFERTASKKTFSAPDLDFNYGWGDHIQLKYQVPLLIVDNSTDPDRGQHIGVGDSLLGFKWRFLDEEQHSLDYQHWRSNRSDGKRRDN